MKKQIIALLLVFTMITGLVAGCGSSSSDTESAGDTTEEASDDEESSDADVEEEEDTAEEVDFDSEENTIRVATQDGQLRTAVEILAYELGYYEEEGVNVEFVNVTTTEALTAITTNKSDVDILATGIVPDLTFIANGSDLVIFEGTAVEGGAIISLEGEADNYKDLADYGGLTVAMVSNESAWNVTRGLLVEEGVDVDSISIVEVDEQVNVATAVVKGEADLGFLPIEYATKSLDLGIEIVYEVGDLEPEYVCCRQVTSSAKLEEKYEALVKYSIANLKAWEYFEDEDNREEAIAILAEHSSQTEEYVESYLFTGSTKLSLDPNEYGVIDYYNNLLDIGYFDGEGVTIEDHIDTAIYAEALSTIIERDAEDEFFQEALEIYREYNDSLL